MIKVEYILNMVTLRKFTDTVAKQIFKLAARYTHTINKYNMYCEISIYMYNSQKTIEKIEIYWQDKF